MSPGSQALGLDRMQLGTLIAAARVSGPMDAALITLLGLLGLRVSEASRGNLDRHASYIVAAFIAGAA